MRIAAAVSWMRSSTSTSDGWNFARTMAAISLYIRATSTPRVLPAGHALVSIVSLPLAMVATMAEGRATAVAMRLARDALQRLLRLSVVRRGDVPVALGDAESGLDPLAH